ncbi:MAG TPA: LCP family protein [Chloroflexota bacterium]|nr:LCP family protein [Chloroflexota bacterium]
MAAGIPTPAPPRRPRWLARGLLAALFALSAAAGSGLGAIAQGRTAPPIPPSARGTAEARAPAAQPPPPAVRAADPRASLPAPLPDWQGPARTNILLMGVDLRPDERRAGLPGRTDVMMVLSVVPAERRVALLSVPRDLAVTVPGVGETKINTAFTYGEVRQTGGGPALAKQIVGDMLGQPIDHYAVVDFGGFERLVDLLDGVDVDVPRALVDDAYPTDDYGTRRLVIPQGVQHMDGATALSYVRSRHMDSDFGRMERQQQLLLALRKRALRWPVLLRAPQLVPEALGAVRTDLGPADLLAFAKVAQQLPAGGLKSLVLAPPFVQPYTGSDGAYLLRLDRARVEPALAALWAGGPAAPRPTVTVATAGTPDLGPTVVAYLRGLGYEVAAPRWAAGAASATAIRAPAGGQAEAEALARALALPAAVVQVDAERAPAAALEVTLGADFRLAPAPP